MLGEPVDYDGIAGRGFGIVLAESSLVHFFTGLENFDAYDLHANLHLDRHNFVYCQGRKDRQHGRQRLRIWFACRIRQQWFDVQRR